MSVKSLIKYGIVVKNCFVTANVRVYTVDLCRDTKQAVAARGITTPDTTAAGG